MTWQDILENYYKKYKYNFVVQKIADFPYPWLNYKTKDYYDFIEKESYVSQREVFPDEVVFDIDMKGDLALPILKTESIKMGETIIERFNKFNINYTYYDSGGSGTHIHCFFPELNKMDQIDSSLMKKLIIKYFARGMLYMHQDDLGKVQTQTLITIQIEEARHRKGGFKTLLRRTEKIESKIPDFLFKELEDYKKQYITYREKLNKDMSKTKPAVISYLESKEFANIHDGKKRALFALCAYYKKFHEDKEVNDLLTKWNAEILNNYLTKKQINAVIKSTNGAFVANYINDLLDDIGVDINKIIT